MPDFILPDFLEGNSTDEIHKRMLDTLPEKMDKSENSFPWDFTRPVALEKAEMLQYNMVLATMNIVPQWATGNFLEAHAENRGIYRRGESYSSVEITFTGISGTVIPQGFKVSTEATLDESSVVFLVDEETTIPESGTIKASATAELSGPVGNVAAKTIILQVKPMNGISSVMNEEASYGGFEMESDDSLRQRIADYDAQQGASFVGSPADYRRWALEVVGVGSADVLSAQDDSGLVTIIIVDANGQPADEDLCKAVEDHIMRPDSKYERLAPINANLKVTPPVVLNIVITANVILEIGYEVETVKKEFMKNVVRYFSEITDAVIRYNDIGAELIKTVGVLDYSNYLLNGTTDNITIKAGELPVIDESQITLVTDGSNAALGSFVLGQSMLGEG